MPMRDAVDVTWVWLIDAIASPAKPNRVRIALKAAPAAPAIPAAILC